MLVHSRAAAAVLTLLLAAPAAAQNATAQKAAPDTTSPVEMTAQQDHQRTMELLGMKTIRPGVSGMNPQAPDYANYDESKANPYPDLPDPLLTQGRVRVTTAEMWWNVRRPEIQELFDREIYGRVPANVPAVKWVVDSIRPQKHGDVPVVVKYLTGRVDNSAYPRDSVNIELMLATPAKARGPVPVVMQFGFRFGPRPGARPGAPGAAGRGAPGATGAAGGRPGAPGAAGAPRPGAPAGARPAMPRMAFVDWQALALAKGWGYAAIYPNSIQADNGAGLTHGIIGLVNHGRPRKLDDWGALRAWAWGVSRAIDYFETDKAVDAKRIALEGHSRYGKATLVAMAYEPRLAVAYVSSSGEGGAKLNRRNAGELVENVAATGEYHWMAGNFLKYAGYLSWDDLPIDAHELIAMCAPRPVFISAGSPNGDAWVDARGMFMAEVAAGPVYELLGKKPLSTSVMPPIGTGLLDGDLAWRQHESGHTDGPNWPYFLDFAERYFGKGK